MLQPYLNKVFAVDALQLLCKLPSESIDRIIADPMFMVATVKGKNCIYPWGIEPGTGKAHEFWEYHHEIYAESRRVLKPGGSLAWAMGAKFSKHFPEWFGGHRIWAFSRHLVGRTFIGQNSFGHIWMVQTKEQQPIRYPDADGLILVGKRKSKGHPCPKVEPEMRFMIQHLTNPGEIVLDCFCGSGTTLVMAEQLGRQWIGCDVCPEFCEIALERLWLCKRQIAHKRRHSQSGIDSAPLEGCV